MAPSHFQFGLKSIFLLMAVVSVLAAVVVAAPSGVAQGIVILSCAWLLFALVIAVCGFLPAMLVYHAVRACGWAWSKCRPRPPHS
jgi:hypothetical protein